MDLVELVLKGKMFEMDETDEGREFFVKRIEDLEALIDCPDQLQYLTRHELMLLASVRVAFPKMSKSSANRRWWIAEQCLEILRPLIDPTFSAWNRNLERTSKPMMNRKGKIGSPYLKPLSGEMHPKGLAFNKKEKKVEVMHNLMHHKLGST
jgi:hypothetical protein